MGEHIHLLCRYLTMAVRLAHWGRTVALDLGNFDLVGRCSVNEAYNYVHAGRVRVTLRMIKVKRADARIRGDALLVNMCQRADSFSRRVGQAMMSKGGFEGGEGPHDNGGGTGGGGGGGWGRGPGCEDASVPYWGGVGGGWRQRQGHQVRERRGGSRRCHFSFSHEREKGGSARRRGCHRCRRHAYGGCMCWLPCQQEQRRRREAAHSRRLSEDTHGTVSRQDSKISLGSIEGGGGVIVVGGGGRKEETKSWIICACSL